MNQTQQEYLEFADNLIKITFRDKVDQVLKRDNITIDNLRTTVWNAFLLQGLKLGGKLVKDGSIEQEAVDQFEAIYTGNLNIKMKDEYNPIIEMIVQGAIEMLSYIGDKMFEVEEKYKPSQS